MSRRRGKNRGAVSRRTIAGAMALGAIVALILVLVVVLAWSVVGGFQLRLGGPTG